MASECTLQTSRILLLDRPYKEPGKSRANPSIVFLQDPFFTLFFHLHLNFPNGLFPSHFRQNALLLVLRNPQLKRYLRLFAGMKFPCRNASGVSENPNKIINDFYHFFQANVEKECLDRLVELSSPILFLDSTEAYFCSCHGILK
jgi:hypothetical protein